jgi:GH35 family endo-1,4-beta-xylanase
MSTNHHIVEGSAARKRRARCRLVVTVMVEGTGAPVKGARVTIDGPSARRPARTNAMGRARFTRLARGKYKVLVVHSCYPDVRKRKTVSPGANEKRVVLAQVSLREAAKKHAIQLHAYRGYETDLNRHILRREGFHGVAVGTFWGLMSPESEYFAWQKTWVHLAHSEGYSIEGTPLVWPHPNPVITPPWTKTLPELRQRDGRSEALRRLGEFMGHMIKTFPQVERWVVVNEPMNLWYHPGRFRGHDLWQAFGVAERQKGSRRVTNPEGRKSVLAAFRIAYRLARRDAIDRRASFKTIFVLNDYGIEGWYRGNPRKARRARRFYALAKWMVKKLKTRRGKSLARKRADQRLLKRLAVGFQMHLADSGLLRRGGRTPKYDSSARSIRAQVKRLKQLGIRRLYVTELDVSTPGLGGKLRIRHDKAVSESKKDESNFNEKAYFETNHHAYEKEFALQRKLIKEAFLAILSQGTCKGITLWDVVDDREYYPGQPDAGGSNFRYHGYLFHKYICCKPSPEDDSYRRKPAFHGLISALLQSPGRSSQRRG